MADHRSLTRIKIHYSAIREDMDKNPETFNLLKIKTNLCILEDEWKEYNNLLNIVSSNSITKPTMEEIEDLYFKIKSELVLSKLQFEDNFQETSNAPNVLIQDLISNQQSFFHEMSQMNQRTASEPQIYLPKFGLPNFDGNYEEFTAFKDIFEESVKNQVQFSEIQKLYYLKACLKGEPAALIRHIPLSSENFKLAWDIISKRYEKKSNALTSLINKFLNQASFNRASAKLLHHTADLTMEVISGLHQLGPEAESRDPWLIRILLEKIDVNTRHAWAFEVANNNFPTLNEFLSFLHNRGDALEGCDTYDKNVQTKPRSTVAIHHSLQASNEMRCQKCFKPHMIYHCEEFLKMLLKEKRDFVSEEKLCFNCLRFGHMATKCKSKFRCQRCKAMHHTLLHSESPIASNSLSSSENSSIDVNHISNFQIKNDSDSQSNNDIIDTDKILVNTNSTLSNTSQTLLPTAIVKIKNFFGSDQPCRVLLDSGAQASIISEPCVKRLKLQRKTAQISIKGLTPEIMTTKGKVQLNIGSYISSQRIQIDALIVSSLPSIIPSQPFFLKKLTDINIQLADPDYGTPKEIDLIIGIDKFFEIIQEGKIKDEASNIIAQNTIFGWVLGGTYKDDCLNPSHIIYNYHTIINIDETLRKFWEMEEPLSDQCQITPEETYCETYFQSTTKRDDDGRFVVQIPFKNDPPQLGNSLNIALKRFYYLENKLQKNPFQKKLYESMINDHINLGYLKEIKDPKIIKNTPHYYLPHHPVYKTVQDVQKLRIVFDGSCKTTNGMSLNDNMYVGPTVQSTLWEILIRFRMNKIAIIADIEKMYLQVKLCEKNQTYQRILWRDSVDDPIKHFQLTRVTFGLSSSPFLAIRCLKQIGYDLLKESPNSILSEKIFRDFYVDDFVSGESTIEKAIQLKHQLGNLLNLYGFNLTKWKSNVSDLSNNNDKYDLNSITNSKEKILGISWDPVNDKFTFKTTPMIRTVPSKRKILSETSKIYDPLGWLAPSTIISKILLQEIWLCKVGWDQNLPKEICDKWFQFRNEFISFESIQIPRFICNRENIELFGFCDASLRAYAAAIYTRTITADGKIHTNLLTAKTKVAPVKPISIPRLELCAAHLLVKLYRALKIAIPNINSIQAWSDSKVVLCWLSKHPSTWKQFVCNRVSDIIDTIPRSQWNYVKSAENPSDLASRGIMPSKLKTQKLWWNGPEWLASPNCPSNNFHLNSENEEVQKEQKIKSTTILTTFKSNDLLDPLLNYTNSYKKMRNILAYVLRFISNLKETPTKRTYGTLSIEEREVSANFIIKWVQNQEFNQEINELKHKKEVNNKSSIYSLSPFIDEKDILRVGGRIENSECSYEAKHPIVLPKKHQFTNMIINYYHIENMHSGPTLTSHLIRQNYWIVHGRSVIRSIIHKCIICFKHKASTSNQLMGDLPSVRVTFSKPFSNCGIDYAGPIMLASKRGRGAKLNKAYIAVFVCMTTKALHIELVTELTTEAFLASLKRFISRRGLPHTITSDNATNFVGANRHLREVFEFSYEYINNSLISEYLAENKIKWKFIPPGAPNFGGLWESAVKSIKYHLNRATTNINLTYEEANTMLCVIESILNSRPLCKVSEDDASINALTPAHFLIGSTMKALPDHNFEDVNESRLSRWQMIEQRTHQFWKRFSLEYINTMQQRSKWKKTMNNLKINDIVLVKEENLPTCKWRIARVVELHPDKKGIVRVVTLQTPTTQIKRSISKVCKLPSN